MIKILKRGETKSPEKIQRLCSTFEEAKENILDCIDFSQSADDTPCIATTMAEVEQHGIAQQYYSPPINQAIDDLSQRGQISKETLVRFNEVAQGTDSMPQNRYQTIYRQRFVDEIAQIQNSKLYKKVMG